MKLPKPISNLIDYFERLPGIGPKTAQRLTFSLLNFPQEELEKFSDSLIQLKKGTKLCKVCKNVTEN
ncbi:MAG TPA: recombination protein RecR, partial [bacterium]|nr:recombination protein RecR [bacterium]